MIHEKRCRLEQRGVQVPPTPTARDPGAVLAPALHSGAKRVAVLPPTPLTARVHSCRRVGPVGLARVPVSFRPATAPPRPHGELDTHSQIWVETTDAGRQLESPPLQGGNREWEGWVSASCGLLKGLGVCVEGRGEQRSHVRMVALELKIAECRERVISLSAVLPEP